MINRKDALEVSGGDTVQMLNTKECLEKLGVKVDVALGEQSIDKYMEYDIIHLFNIQTYKFSYAEVIKIKKANKPLAVSTIWWDFDDIYLNLLIKYSNNSSKAYKILGENGVKFLKRIQNSYINSKQKKIVTNADVLLPNAWLEYDSLERSFGKISKEKVKIAPNGVDDKFFEEYECDIPEELNKVGLKSKGYAIQVGRIDPGKNTLMSIKACKKLNIPLVLIGLEPNKKYSEVCRKEAEGSRVYFMGIRKPEEIIPFYKHAKVHVLPSYRETPGLASLEAAAIGCKIVSTEIGSAKDYFGELAWYCSPIDIVSVVNALKKAWDSDVTDYSLMERIKSNFTWKEAAKVTLEAYNMILK